MSFYFSRSKAISDEDAASAYVASQCTKKTSCCPRSKSRKSSQLNTSASNTPRLYSTATPTLLHQSYPGGNGGSDGCRCPVCGYAHGNSSKNEDKPGGGGDDNPPGSGGSGGGGDGKPDGSGDAPGKDDDPSGDGGNGGDPAPGGNMNGDDPEICPDCCTNPLFYIVCIILFLSVLALWGCLGTESLSDCLGFNEDRCTALNKKVLEKISQMPIRNTTVG